MARYFKHDPGSLIAAALSQSDRDGLAPSDSVTSATQSEAEDRTQGPFTTSIPLLSAREQSMAGLSHSLPRCSPTGRSSGHNSSVQPCLRHKTTPKVPTTWPQDECISVRSHEMLAQAKPSSEYATMDYEAQELMASGLPVHEYMFILLSSSIAASALSFCVDEFSFLMGKAQQAVSNQTANLGQFSWVVSAAINVFICVVARLIVRTTAQAEGSGIPEVKTMLFGQVKMVKEFLRLRVLCVKTAALAMIVGGGLPIGKEGPFVHLASCITANIYPNFFAKTAGAVFPFLLASVAVGVGTTFSAPLGGVIFALELMLPQVYDMTSYLGCFVASVVGSIIFTVLKTSYSNENKGLVALMSSDVHPGEGVTSKYPIVELALNGVLGLICGTLGGIFIMLHTWTQGKLKQWRISATPTPKDSFDSSMSTPLLRGLGSAVSVGPEQANWADDSSREVTMADRVLSGPSKCLGMVMKKCGGFQWRDIFQVGIVALINTGLTENIPMLKNVTMPQLLVSLFGKTFHTGSVWGYGPELSMIIIFCVKWTMTILALALPVPTGVVAPTMVMGAIIGRSFYLLIPEWLQDLYLSEVGGGPVTDIQRGALGARLAIVGAAAFCSAVTRAFSMAITVFEVLALPGSVLPLSCASLLAMWAANHVSPSFFDQILINKGFFGISAMSSAKASLPASRVMHRYTDYHTKCISHRAYLGDLERVLKNATEVNFPIVQRVRDTSNLNEHHTEGDREWDLPLLVGTVSAKVVREVVKKHHANWNPHTIIDFLDPKQFSAEQMLQIMRTPLHVDARTAVKDVFLLWKVMNVSADAEPIVYVTDKGHLLGVIRGEELVGKKS